MLIQTPLHMVLQSSIEFIETALTITTGSYALSYTEPEQRWYILKDLPSLLLEFPSLRPSMDTFTYTDGDNVNLLKVQGTIPVEDSAIAVTIWIHEGYPYIAPIVFVHRDHNPFVDPASGAMVTPYISTWDYRRCNLVGLARNLVKIFSGDIVHGFSSDQPYGGLKREALLDLLTGMLNSDTVELKSKLKEEIDQLLSLQHQMEKRAETTREVTRALMHEKMKLKCQAMQFAQESDVLTNWLKVHNSNNSAAIEDDDNGIMDEAFQIVGEESKLKLHCISQDNAIEDTIYALDEAVDQRVLTFGDYIKQVRMLAREQFCYRALLSNNKLEK